jgi:Na+/proline symporter
MNYLDWLILGGTLLFIVSYGVYKSRGSKDIEDYLLGDKSIRWWTIGLSIMATQASAITFLSTPGQAYEDGMRFIQIYLGQPLALIILAITFVPIFHRLKVYTAYEFLETRFDLKTRSLASFLFLIQRGLAAGITIYAPSIILSTILDLNLTITNIIIGTLVIIYTVSGGTKAVSITQKQQMAVMMGGMIAAGLFVIHYLPENIGFSDAVNVAGHMGKLEAIELSFDPSDRYNIWSGLIGGLFIGLSYFGTDQSQVQRYISGSSIRESRLGLIFNGLLKIPMQFIILFIGAMVFVFYQFNAPPMIFNKAAVDDVYASEYADEMIALDENYTTVHREKKEVVQNLVEASRNNNESQIKEATNKLDAYSSREKEIRNEAKEIITKVNPDAETNDTDYIFITFVVNHLPHGMIGILLAVIFSAAMSSTASELNALASTTTVDLYKRSVNKTASPKHYLASSRIFTLLWGILAITFATFASLLENLIELVNIVGSLFYGSILGIFLTAFYIKFIRANAIFIGALLSQTTVLLMFNYTDIGYLWYNPIGVGATILFAAILQGVLPGKK